MKRSLLQTILVIILGSLLIGFVIWGIWYVDKIEHQISILGIVAAITAALTSVITVTLNHQKTKQREYELLILKEKQKVYEHFYNSFFDALKNSKKGQKKLPSRAVNEMMLFKQGLMNWGSEELINEFIEYDNKLNNKPETFQILKDGNQFLLAIRKDMGFEDSKNLNLVSIILDGEARRELLNGS